MTGWRLRRSLADSRAAGNHETLRSSLDRVAVEAHFVSLVDCHEIPGTGSSVGASLEKIHRFSEAVADLHYSSHVAAYEKAVVEGHGVRLGGRDARIGVVVLGHQYVEATGAFH